MLFFIYTRDNDNLAPERLLYLLEMIYKKPKNSIFKRFKKKNTIITIHILHFPSITDIIWAIYFKTVEKLIVIFSIIFSSSMHISSPNMLNHLSYLNSIYPQAAHKECLPEK